MKLVYPMQVLLTGCFLFICATKASASLYEIICVECQLSDAGYTLQDSSGVVDSGPVIFPSSSGDFQFNTFGLVATARNSQFYYNTGTYQFITSGDTYLPAHTISMTVNPGQIGMFFQFNWNGTTSDALNVFDVAYNNGDTILTPTDVDGNGIVGFAVPQGAFVGTDLALNFTVATPLPAALWLFVSAIPGLFFFARRKKS